MEDLIIPTVQVDLNEHILFPLNGNTKLLISTYLGTKGMIDEAFITYIRSSKFAEMDDTDQFHFMNIRSAIFALYHDILHSMFNEGDIRYKCSLNEEFAALAMSSRAFAENLEIISDVFFFYLNHGEIDRTDDAWVLDYTRTLQFLTKLMKLSLYSIPGFTY